ncbi:MAG: ATP-binding cassette domain-containing protein, partial [Desulfovibrionaceae bacterium]|nr:ATP-binding cassette domain-containing protein [Desulfovibrionaceae bacterium]
MNIITIKNLTKERKRSSGFGLEIRSLSVAAGEHIAIVGPSGCGKSTTLDLIGMILEPDCCATFTANFADEVLDIADLWKRGQDNVMAQVRKRHMGYVLQTGELLPYLTVWENVELTALEGRRKGAGMDVDELLRTLAIDHIADAMPDAISIGERQRAAIARALASSPALLLADEPTAALDPHLSRVVMNLFLQVARQVGTAVVMVSHDVALVDAFH